MASNNKSAFADKKMLGRAIKDSFVKLNPKTQVQNPVMLFGIYFGDPHKRTVDCIPIRTKGRFKRIYLGNRSYSVVYLYFCQFCRSDCRGQRQGAGGRSESFKKDVEAHKIPSADKKEQITAVSSALLKKATLSL